MEQVTTMSLRERAKADYLDIQEKARKDEQEKAEKTLKDRIEQFATRRDMR